MSINKNSFHKGATKTYNRNLIDSLSEYLEYIHYIQDSSTVETLWFRGVSKAKYKLIPRIYRKDIWTYNHIEAKNITNRFIHKAKGHISPSSKFEKWEWYQIMQHYGLPTRFLDWTEGHLIALFFAIRNLISNSTPCVWILNPFSLNEFSSDNDSVFFTDITTREDIDNKIIDSYLEDTKSGLPPYPIAIEPANINERMTAQRACFTIHGKVHDGFSSAHRLYTKFELFQLRIRTKSAEQIKNQLTLAGISESTLFPDLEGVVRDLMYETGMNIY